MACNPVVMLGDYRASRIIARIYRYSAALESSPFLLARYVVARTDEAKYMSDSLGLPQVLHRLRMGRDEFGVKKFREVFCRRLLSLSLCFELGPYRVQLARV